MGLSADRTVGRLAILASVSALALGLAPAARAGDSQPVTPFYNSNIKPFYAGNIKPFYSSSLKPFFGSKSPFWGDPSAFWGDDAAFTGNTSLWWGTLDPVKYPARNAPAYLKIQPYWTKAGGDWSNIMSSWDSARTSSNYRDLARQIQALLDKAEDFWGDSVKATSGKSFTKAVETPLLNKWGIDLDNPNSLSKLDPTERASFFLEWYDTLMNYAGTDHVDWWMKTVNWSPSLTQTQGSGLGTTIGLLDVTVVGDTTLLKSIVKYDGVSTFSNGHGAAVGSLIVGANDKKGVMGIAPKAKVVAYNPFDKTGTASWDDVADGILMLSRSGASIVNMSLGVPGTTLDRGWNKVFSNFTMAQATRNVVFVTAAGNDGLAQTNDIRWNFDTNPTLIVVGSVGLDGTISNFSNTPGYACLLDGGDCKKGNRLMDRFIVAPGELILVSDDKGGSVRQSGTSFAAPLVSGAIALLHDRWPWLQQYPDETASIILKSAKDLGAKGTDPVYGVGLLDIQASQSPLSFNNLRWYSVKNGKQVEMSAADVVKEAQKEKQKSWDAQGRYFYAFETVGKTQRDFAIPLSSKLVGQTFTSLGGAQAYFQAYLVDQMDAWVKRQSFADGSGTYRLGNRWGADLTLSMAPRAAQLGFRDEGSTYQTSLKVQGERSTVSFGFGDGAVSLAGQPGFALASDYQADRGGANPLLGLASGGGYAKWSLALSDRLQLSAGATGRNERRDGRETPIFDQPGNGAHAYKAGAEHVALDYRVTDRLDLIGGYTRLREDQALLGIQSLDPQDFAGGATTDGVTFGFNWRAGGKLTVSAAGTFARTRPAGEAQAMAVSRDGLTSQAYQVSLNGRDLFKRGDAARLTFAQPMFVDHGSLDVQTVEVIDRSTGEIGVVSHNWDISQRRNFSAEALYSMPLLGERGDLALFGHVETMPGAGLSDLRSYVAGGRFRVAF